MWHHSVCMLHQITNPQSRSEIFISNGFQWFRFQTRLTVPREICCITPWSEMWKKSTNWCYFCSIVTLQCLIDWYGGTLRTQQCPCVSININYSCWVHYFSSCVILPVPGGNSAEAGGYRCYRESPTCNVPSLHSLPSSLDVVLPLSCPQGCSTHPQGPPGPQRLHDQESALQTLHLCRKHCRNSFLISW